jgi:hypothetical protein
MKVNIYKTEINIIIYLNHFLPISSIQSYENLVSYCSLKRYINDLYESHEFERPLQERI